MKDDAQDYAGAGFGGKVGFGKKPAVILVDPARAYIEPGAPLYVGSQDALHAMISLASEARQNGVPVIFTRVEYLPGGADGGHFYNKVAALSLFQSGGELGEFDSRLSPHEGDIVVTKQYPSAFFGTSLASTLQFLDVDTCLIAGYSTSGCVRATSLDALQYGFRPIVVAPACGDRSAAVQKANLFDLDQKYADVVNMDAAVNYLASV